MKYIYYTVDDNGIETKQDGNIKNGYYEVVSNQIEWNDGKWYVVKENIEFNDLISVIGTVICSQISISMITG